ncbi:MAG: hypothetical protein M3Z96_14730 [Pseudomonadota bacterium]|nr:hypothetical protein [Pseudomonadota bacterium]
MVARNCQSFRHQSLRESLLKPQRITPALIGKDQLSQRSMPLVLAGFWAVSISGNWRVIFRFEGEHARDVDLIDYH